MPDASYTPNASLKAGSFADLCTALKSTYMNFAFEHEGQEFAIRLRRITSDELAAADAHVRGLIPPLRKRWADAEGKAPVDEKGRPVHDFDDPGPELRAAIQKRLDELNAESKAMGGETVGWGYALMQEKYDYADEGYQKQRTAAQERQRATVLHYGCEGGLGEDDAARVSAMRKGLPDVAAALLVQQILLISSRGLIHRASFY